jgi:hypothetical protein
MIIPAPNDCCRLADHVFLSADVRSLFSSAGNASDYMFAISTGVGDIFVLLFVREQMPSRSVWFP